MMILYSGTTCPFSHRCRIVLYEKGMDFQINDVDLHGKKNELSVMNPYNRTPVLVERDLILYESNIINEYIDDRFPHPQLMPADPISKSRARLFLFRFENELKKVSVGNNNIEYNNYIKDLVTFLAFASEPNRVDRKIIGLYVVLFLIFLLIPFTLLKNEFWKDIKK